MNKKSFVVLVCFIFNTAFCFGEFTKNIYNTIQLINMSSLAWEDEDWPYESFGDYLNRCLKYQLAPQAFKKRRIVFKLFSKLSCSSLIQHNALYDITTIQDLQLFAGKKVNETYVAEIVDRTKTELGKVFLYGLVSSPTIDVTQLQARQNIIKYLITDTYFFNNLTAIYDQYALSENMLLSLWSQDGFVNASKRRYFLLPWMNSLSEKLNSSTLALEIKSLWDHQQRGINLLSTIIAAVILPMYGLSNIVSMPLPSIINKLGKRLQGSGSKLLVFLQSIANHTFVNATTSFAAGAVCSIASREEYEWARDNITLDLCMQKKMILIAQFFNNIVKLADRIESNPAFMKICPAASYIHDFMYQNRNDQKLQRLFYLCSTTTFNGEPSIFAVQGRVLVTFRLIYDLKEKIEPLLMAIGELDAYCSCARLYNEFKHKKVKFCFANYKESTHPIIRLKSFWNPLIHSEKVIPNDVCIQNPIQRNMIITGPNAGGKSSIITAMPINLVLAQSIGLVAAEYAEITPFYSIATYINIVDDITAGNSLFKAQVLRAQEIINVVETTPQHLFSFTALDEMFNGTSVIESTASAYSVANHLGKYTNNISVIATHFPLLTKLENEQKSFINYKVSVSVDTKGRISYPFILEQGTSDQHIALDILRQEGFASTIITQAEEIIKRVTHIR